MRAPSGCLCAVASIKSNVLSIVTYKRQNIIVNGVFYQHWKQLSCRNYIKVGAGCWLKAFAELVTLLFFRLKLSMRSCKILHCTVLWNWELLSTPSILLTPAFWPGNPGGPGGPGGPGMLTAKSKKKIIMENINPPNQEIQQTLA